MVAGVAGNLGRGAQGQAKVSGYPGLPQGLAVLNKKAKSAFLVDISLKGWQNKFVSLEGGRK
jgi:hypothetical protein